MTNFDKIFDFAIDNHYLVSSKQAKNFGVPNIELVKLAHRGKLERITYGVYRLNKYVPSDEDPYAIAVASVDDDAWLYGESVLELLNLCATNPKVIHVATNKRIRKDFPNNICIVNDKNIKDTKIYKGIKCQSVFNAIYSCFGKIMTDRLQDALLNGKEQGYITQKEYKVLRNELYHEG